MANKYLEERCLHALDLLDEQRHRAYARAIRVSVTIDLNAAQESMYPPNVFRADQIETAYNFTMRDQRAYGIGLTLRDAYPFISQFRAIGEPTFRREYSATKYYKKYGVKPTLLTAQSNRMLLTYAEWIHFVDLTIELDLPLCIIDILE